jgi:hypothetical protein
VEEGSRVLLCARVAGWVGSVIRAFGAYQLAQGALDDDALPTRFKFTAVHSALRWYAAAVVSLWRR